MPLARSAGLRLLTAVAVLGLAAAPAHANRRTGAKLNAIGKKEPGPLTCRAKVAAKNDTSGLSACETKVT
jgi:hypothetical protein